ncbi:MAG: hypothetical protein EKK48_17285 [Candidatus Melainabacteria bacterium]|nr:MAG: hypothetical protein EKK48_17285 [Candidatus Melainabacteria bacterium]
MRGSRFYLFCMCLLQSLAAGFGAARAADVSQDAKPSSIRLTGGVVHSERLTPVPVASMPGKTFNLAAAFGPNTSKAPAKKFAVPNWLAGTWERTQSTEVSRVNLATNTHAETTGTSVARVTDKFGTYKDAQGRVWQLFDPRKATGQIDRGNFMDYHRVSTYDLISRGDKVAIVEVTALHLVVNKKTQKIISTFQDEELNTYTQVSDGQLRTDSSVKVFDAHGKPIYLTRSTSLESRLAPFKG